jgi:hypothetical protein
MRVTDWLLRAGNYTRARGIPSSDKPRAEPPTSSPASQRGSFFLRGASAMAELVTPPRGAITGNRCRHAASEATERTATSRARSRLGHLILVIALERLRLARGLPPKSARRAKAGLLDVFVRVRADQD